MRTMKMSAFFGLIASLLLMTAPAMAQSSSARFMAAEGFGCLPEARVVWEAEGKRVVDCTPYNLATTTVLGRVLTQDCTGTLSQVEMVEFGGQVHVQQTEIHLGGVWLPITRVIETVGAYTVDEDGIRYEFERKATIFENSGGPDISVSDLTVRWTQDGSSYGFRVYETMERNSDGEWEEGPFQLPVCLFG